MKSEKYSIEWTDIILPIELLVNLKDYFLRIESQKWNYCQSILTSLWFLMLIAKMLSKSGCTSLNCLQYQYPLYLYLDYVCCENKQFHNHLYNLKFINLYSILY